LSGLTQDLGKKRPGLSAQAFFTSRDSGQTPRGIGLVSPEWDRLVIIRDVARKIRGFKQEVKIATRQRRIGFQGGMFPERRSDRGRFPSTLGTLVVTR
jgi:hypothetical protein